MPVADTITSSVPALEGVVDVEAFVVVEDVVVILDLIRRHVVEPVLSDLASQCLDPLPDASGCIERAAKQEGLAVLAEAEALGAGVGRGVAEQERRCPLSLPAIHRQQFVIHSRLLVRASGFVTLGR